MQRLNFPDYAFSVRQPEKPEIFDPIRKRYVALTPEEWVRQHVIRYLLENKGYPSGLLSVEGSVRLYNTKKRYDIAAFSRDQRPLVIVECKAPEVPVNDKVVDQVIRYNMALPAPYLMITNGLVHIFLKMESNQCIQINEIPDFSQINAEQ